MSRCLSLIYFVSFRQSHKVDDKRKYGKVVKITNVTRGKSLIDSHWVKLKYKTGIFERYYARIVVKGYLRKDDFDLLSFERMISTFWASKGWFRAFWALYPDFLSCCCSVSFSTHCYPWILRVWLRYSVCLLSVLLYQYRNESAWKAIPGYPLKDDECLELQYAIYGLKQLRELPTFSTKKCTLKLDLHSLKLMSVAWYWWKVMWRVVQHPSHPRPNRT